MADPELVRAMDYILNRCDEKGIDAVAAAVVRRRRELAMFGGAANLPDPKRLARDLSAQINVSANIDGLREEIRKMAVKIIRQEAPELNDGQIAQLTAAWIPGPGSASSGASPIPAGMLLEMTDQFVRFSTGKMGETEDKKLRTEMGQWTSRYWKAFPEVVKLIIKDYLDGEITEGEYRGKLAGALAIDH
ncbi:MAG: hypothetical protein LBB82_04640 [Treponema sp.]|jgi:hypothetical protein|nr:hypothetical protein [Treponema sp.]